MNRDEDGIGNSIRGCLGVEDGGWSYAKNGTEGEGYTYEFLCDHTAHTDAHDMKLLVFGPAEVVKEIKTIFGHFGGRVAEERGVGSSHAWMLS